MPQGPRVPPSQRIQSGNMPGVQNARPAPDAAMESLMVAQGQALQRMANELMKGRNANSTEVARSMAMLRQIQQARRGFGNRGHGQLSDGRNLQGGPGARRDIDTGVDPHTQNPMNSVPSGNNTQPFIT